MRLDAKHFFGEIVEPLCDAFEPRYCDLYADLMSALLGDPALRDRYEQIRHPQPWRAADPQVIYVLSRVTLGADVVVTSTVLDGLKRRFPTAQLVLVGNRKAWELFAADPRIHFLEAPYARGGSIDERLQASRALATRLDAPNALIVDPDSRLTQLGIVPVCPDHRYRFFESRAYGADTTAPLAQLTANWMHEVFEVEANPYIVPQPFGKPGVATVSLGVGENPAKRVDDHFERGLIEALVARNLEVVIDYGAGEEEAARVDRAIAGLPVKTFRGPFAPFAAQIAQSRLYVGYDSAGQHVAAVSGVPLITVFTGYATPRTFHRWHPSGPGPKVVLTTPQTALQDTLAALDHLL